MNRLNKSPMGQYLHPAQPLARDLGKTHLDIAVGAAFNAVREMTGKTPNERKLKKHMAMVIQDDSVMEILWKKNVVLRVFPAETKVNGRGQLVRFRRIDEVWKKRAGSV